MWLCWFGWLVGWLVWVAAGWLAGFVVLGVFVEFGGGVLKCGCVVVGEDEFVPWVTPLHASLYKGPFRVGVFVVFGPDVSACRLGRRVALRCFYGLEGVEEVWRDG